MDQDQEESEEGEKGSVAQMGSLLRRGLRIGKKVVIAGAAISSAPVVIPPLVVGLAFAFPFGIYFAGFVCTDKVMRALLSNPYSVVHGERREEEEKEWEIDVCPSTIIGEDDEKSNGGDKLGMEGPKWLVEEGASKKQKGSAEKGQMEMKRDEPTKATVEHEIEMWPPTTIIDITRDGDNGEENNIMFKHASSLDDMKDIIQDSGVEEEERPMQVESRAEEKGQMRNGEVREKEKETIDAQQMIESSDLFTVNDHMRSENIASEFGEKPIEVNGKVDEVKTEQDVEEFQYTVNQVSIVKCDESNNVTQPTAFCSESASVVEYEKETEVNIVIQTEVVLEGRSEGIVDEVKDLPPIVLETEELLTDVDHSPASVPEDHVLDSKHSDFSSEHASATPSYKDGGSIEPVELEGGVIGEEKVEDDRSDVIHEDDMMTACDSAVAIATMKSETEILVSSMSTKYTSLVNDYSLDMTKSESGLAKIIVGTAKVKDSDDEETDEIKQTEVTLEGRSEGIEDEVRYMPPFVLEAEKLLTAVQDSLAIIPEEREMNSKDPDLGSERAVSTTSYKDGDTIEPIEVEGGIMGEVSVENDRSAVLINRAYHSIVSLSPLESEREIPVSTISTVYESAVEDHSSDTTDAEAGSAKIVVETAVQSDDEVSYSQEMMWEQIHAMRTIVGYKAVGCSSLVEELKALYLFTGVEPPVSLEDTSDFVEIGDKLNFLKSVIGVK